MELPSKSLTSLSLLKENSTSDFTDFIFIFNKATGSNKVAYLTIDRNGKRTRMIPKIDHATINKVKDLVGYRAIVLDNFLYILGGRHLQSGSYISYGYRFNPRNNEWARIADMTNPRTRFAVAKLNGFMYVSGGETRGGVITNSVECYDPVSDKWAEVCGMPKPRADHASCSVANKLFVSGGVEEKKDATASFWQYDPESDFWAQASGSAMLPKSRERHCMLEFRGRIFILGGMTFKKAGKKFTQTEDGSMVSFDCSAGGSVDTQITGMWDRSHPDMHRPRCMGAAFTLGNHIYIVGGHNYTDDRDEVTVAHYSPRRKKWHQSFSLGRENAFSVDVCTLRIPKSNVQFSSLGLAMTSRWPLW